MLLNNNNNSKKASLFPNMINDDSGTIKMKHIMLFLQLAILFLIMIMLFQLNGRDSQIIKLVREECASQFGNFDKLD